MAWNEPGKGGKDPWGRGGGKPNGPDLEELLRRLRQRLGGLGGGSGGSAGFLLLVVALLLIWVVSGFYKVDSAEKAAVMRFGRLEHINGPGLHWHLPYPIETVKKVNVSRIRSFTYQSDMLTADENIVHLEMEVQYRVKNAKDYLFQISDPDATLGEATKSAIREVVGTSKMNYVLSGQGKSKVADRTESILQQNLNDYKSGLVVTTVNIRSAQPPQQVQAAFSDAIKAQEDKQRSINQAKAYSNQILPKAQGDAAQQIAQAKGYAQKVVEQAKGRTSRFEQLIPAYRAAPEVTRTRLYLDTMQNILEHSSKVLLDVKKGNPLMYLPLNKMIHAQQPGKSQSGSGASQSSSQSNQGGGQGSGSQGSGTGAESGGQPLPSGMLGRGRNR